MKITGFNEVTVDGIKYDLSEKRIEIIKAECDRIRNSYITYGEVTFIVSITGPLHKHLMNLDFKIVDDKIKLGEVSFSINDKREYLFNDKGIKGTITEIKKEVTRLIEGCDPLITVDGVWFLSEYVELINYGKNLSDLRSQFIEKEMDKICQLK